MKSTLSLALQEGTPESDAGPADAAEQEFDVQLSGHLYKV